MSVSEAGSRRPAKLHHPRAHSHSDQNSRSTKIVGTHIQTQSTFKKGHAADEIMSKKKVDSAPATLPTNAFIAQMIDSVEAQREVKKATLR